MLNDVKSPQNGKKNNFIYAISLDGFVAAPKGEMNGIKVDEEIFDHVGKRITEGDTALYGRVPGR